MKVLLTVPHGGCVSSIGERHCDRKAMAMCQALQVALQRKKIEVDVVVNQDLRSQYDANRESGYRNSQFGETIHAKLHSKVYDYVIDCHSYPPRPDTPVHFYILDFPPFQSINVRLRARGLQNGLDCDVMTASPVNSIIMDARAANVAHTLLEVSESLKVAQLMRIAILVADNYHISKSNILI